jgi:hypothetical protein
MKYFGIISDIPKDITDDRITLDFRYEVDQVATKDLEPINWME